jgi:hypothetical protein
MREIFPQSAYTGGVKLHRYPLLQLLARDHRAVGRSKNKSKDLR